MAVAFFFFFFFFCFCFCFCFFFMSAFVLLSAVRVAAAVAARKEARDDNDAVDREGGRESNDVVSREAHRTYRCLGWSDNNRSPSSVAGANVSSASGAATRTSRFVDYAAVNPPSTTSSEPVINELSFENKKTVAAAI